MSLSVSQQRVLLWLPAETLAESGSGLIGIRFSSVAGEHPTNPL